MIPQVLPVGSNITSELVCSIPYKGYEWSFVYILMHSSTDSNVMLNVSNDGMINSYYSRVNGSLSLDDKFINITVVFDARPGAELCQLNQTYTCDIKLEDSLIGTVAANSKVILESEYLIWYFTATSIFGETLVALLLNQYNVSMCQFHMQIHVLQLQL